MVSRAQIAKVLRDWQAGELTARAVYDWAQERYRPGVVEFDDREADDASAAHEVMAALDQLPLNLVLPEDIPLYLEFLAVPRGEWTKGYERFHAALDRINYPARRIALSGDEFYGPFCQSG